jgi:hypothetical protein
MGTRISLLSLSDCNFTNLMSIARIFPRKPFTDIFQPRLKGFVKRIYNPLKRLVKMSLAAKPTVRPVKKKYAIKGDRLIHKF